jgi:hypothetical protein
MTPSLETDDSVKVSPTPVPTNYRSSWSPEAWRRTKISTITDISNLGGSSADGLPAFQIKMSFASIDTIYNPMFKTERKI